MLSILNDSTLFHVEFFLILYYFEIKLFNFFKIFFIWSYLNFIDLIYIISWLQPSILDLLEMKHRDFFYFLFIKLFWSYNIGCGFNKLARVDLNCLFFFFWSHQRYHKDEIILYPPFSIKRQSLWVINTPWDIQNKNLQSSFSTTYIFSEYLFLEYYCIFSL